MLRYITNWELLDTESCSDHKLITYKITSTLQQPKHAEPSRKRYKITQESWTVFYCNISKEFSKLITGDTSMVDHREIDAKAAEKINKRDLNFKGFMEEYSNIVERVCSQSFQVVKQKVMKNRKTVPWWTKELTEARNSVTAYRDYTKGHKTTKH